MDIVQIPEELTNELKLESQHQNIKRLKSINTKVEKFVYNYSKKILNASKKDEMKYKIEYVYYSKQSENIVTKYDIEYQRDISKRSDVFHTSILCLNDIDPSYARIFVCDIDTDKYKYKLFENEPLSLLKIRKNSIIQLQDSKCYGICPVQVTHTELLIINIIEKQKNTIFKDIDFDNESIILQTDYELVATPDIQEKEIEMKLSKDFYKDFLYKKVCSHELRHVMQLDTDVYLLSIKNELKKEYIDIMETLCDNNGNPVQKFLQRAHERSVIQKNVCAYILNEYEETGQIELFMDIKPNLIKLFTYYFNDLYEHFKKTYNIHDKNNVNMNQLKIMKTKKLEINNKQLICIIPLENVIVNTSDNMKYIIDTGDLFVYFNEELIFEKEMKMIYYTISINP